MSNLYSKRQLATITGVSYRVFLKRFSRLKSLKRAVRGGKVLYKIQSQEALQKEMDEIGKFDFDNRRRRGKARVKHE